LQSQDDGLVGSSGNGRLILYWLGGDFRWRVRIAHLVVCDLVSARRRNEVKLSVRRDLEVMMLSFFAAGKKSKFAALKRAGMLHWRSSTVCLISSVLFNKLHMEQHNKEIKA
jgi:hypothetical protein